MKKSYLDKVDWLFHQLPVFQKVGESAYKPTLDNAKAITKYFNVPLEKMKFIHVAGTNGKGTTCSIIASYLTEKGYKMGLFTSPHIKDFRERIRINGEMIPEEKVENYIDGMQETTFNFSPSFFEMTWGMALDYFYRENCDVVVVETGLGGRLDATNIIQPMITAITNIALDHVKILGNTRKEIAFEKAGIIKKNTPIVIGESDDEVKPVFVEKAGKENAPISFLDLGKERSAFEINLTLAFAVLQKLNDGQPLDEKLKKQAIQHLNKNTGWYGRYQILQEIPLIIVDAAHNLSGVERFISTIRSTYPHTNVNVLYGASNDKDVEKIAQLFPQGWTYYITEFQSTRSMKQDELKNVKAFSHLNVTYFSDAKEAFREAKSRLNKDDMLIVFGSFYLLETIL